MQTAPSGSFSAVPLCKPSSSTGFQYIYQAFQFGQMPGECRVTLHANDLWLERTRMTICVMNELGSNYQVKPETNAAVKAFAGKYNLEMDMHIPCGNRA